MNRRSFLGLFGKMAALAAVPTALLRAAPVADEGPRFMVSPYWPLWLENNSARLADHVHDAGGEHFVAGGGRVKRAPRVRFDPL